VADGTGDVPRLCQELIDELVAEGFQKPSVYLVRGNRLRIQAVAGYHQVFDGMPFGVGVIGRVYVTGDTTVIDDVDDDGDYRAANPTVRAEIATPIELDGRVVGVLNVESSTPFGAGAVERIERAAADLGRQLETVGTVPESAAQRLVRHAIRLGALTRMADVQREAVRAAREVGAMDTALLLMPSDTGPMAAVATGGELAAAVADAPPEDIAAIAALVANGCSSYTVGGTTETAAELAALRAQGAEAVIAVPLPRRRGVLLLADRRPLIPATDTVELLEALAAQIESCLRTAAALEELRERAATDPLTGLGHHATFYEALGRARERREAIAVLLCDVDGFKAINDTRGHLAGDRVLREIAAALSGGLRRGDELFRIGGDEFAAIIRVAGGEEALAAGRRLQQAGRSLGDVTLSIGAALPRPDEDAEALIARADEALYQVKAEGRDGVALLS
jgi:diguanylate cyclase (GGDEF)-like protein